MECSFQCSSLFLGTESSFTLSNCFFREDDLLVESIFATRFFNTKCTLNCSCMNFIMRMKLWKSWWSFYCEKSLRLQGPVLGRDFGFFWKLGDFVSWGWLSWARSFLSFFRCEVAFLSEGFILACWVGYLPVLKASDALSLLALEMTLEEGSNGGIFFLSILASSSYLDIYRKWKILPWSKSDRQTYHKCLLELHVVEWVKQGVYLTVARRQIYPGLRVLVSEELVVDPYMYGLGFALKFKIKCP